MFPGAEPYVSLVENVGFCGEKHKSCGTVARLFPVRFQSGKRGGRGFAFGDKKGRLPCFAVGDGLQII